MSWAVSRAGEPHSLGIFPKFYPRGVNSFARYTSPISPALWGHSAVRNYGTGVVHPTWSTEGGEPRRGVPRCHLPSLFTGAPGMDPRQLAPRYRGVGWWTAPITPSQLRRPAPLPALRPLLSPCSQKLWDPRCWNTWVQLKLGIALKPLRWHWQRDRERTRACRL